MKGTIGFQVKVEKDELYFVDNVLKAYEGLALTTVVGVKGEIGILNLEATEGTKDDVLEILENLQKQVELEIVEGE
ncbi:DUF4911 domain-containing protein [Orenia metallireducens]|uniref:DUF4911 domain-containing protein n=1 Tax=Orenia metallireducens TaxID=1413210 RepID=A0A1C0A968_9FIRM|nr:DUF4911 domain-containing protein [Orenia metallireducens]OCL26841.1 DUF4911 domain-containing protein [Orenia metallireducens]